MGDRLVLCYHRVVETLPSDPFDPLTRYGLCVEAKRFRQQMEYVARHYRVVPLDELVASDDVPGERRTLAAVTFDDGYADNYVHAMPILERAGVPATIFLVTRNVGSGTEFWWDRLARYLSRHAGQPLPLSLDVPATIPESPEEVCELFDILHGRLRTLAGPARDAMLDVMAEPAAADAARPVTWDEVRRMAAAGLTFGAHSASHPSLVAVSDAELRSETARPREEIAARVGTACTTFSYPFGDVDDRVASAVEAAGYRGAFTVRPAHFHAGSCRFRLPRRSIRNVDRNDFIELLRRLPPGTGEASREGWARGTLRRTLPLPVRVAGRYVRRVWRNHVSA